MKQFQKLLIMCVLLTPCISEHYQQIKPLPSLEELKQLVLKKPNNISARIHLAEKLESLEQYEQAIAHLEYALKLESQNINVLFKLGYLHTRIGNIDLAVNAYAELLKLRPNNPAALYNTGYALKEADKIDEAITYFAQTIALNPTYENAYLALSRAYIKKGDFEHGWVLHERYLKKSNKNAEKLRTLLAKNELAGKTIFLIPEGGLGDTLQFIRYAQLLKEYNTTVIALIQQPLIPLLARCPYINKIVTTGDRKPVCDANATLMSLPTILNSNEKTLPKNIPYIFPDPMLVSHWQQQLSLDTNFKIGICWQASSANDASRSPIARRGIPLAKMLQLCELPQISVYSLQKHDDTNQLQELPHDCTLKNFGNNFDTTHGAFMDTAAIMQNLDLIITVDTAIAHLAGALGKPVWVLLPYSTDWRWIVGRTDSPWYPTMKLFKQSTPFDWETVMYKVMQELQSIKGEQL